MIMENLEGRYFYFQAHNTLAYHPEMNLKALRLFAKIEYYANGKAGYCWAQNDTLAQGSGLSMRSVQNNIALLKKLGFIRDETTTKTYKNKLGVTKFKDIRCLYVTLAKNILPDYVPSTIEYNENKYLDIGGTVSEYPPSTSVEYTSNTTISNTKILSKESNKDFSNPIPVPVPFLLEEWRDYKQVPKSQHHPKENSRIHKDINKYTKWLMDGNFGSRCSVSAEFIEQQKIPKSSLNHKFTKQDLIDGLYEMSKMFQEGYPPENKDSISKRSFAGLIYCPRTRLSYLLKYLCKDAQPLEYKTVQVDEDWLDRIYDERLFSKDIENDNHQFGILKKGLFGIEQYYDWIAEKKLTHAQLKSADDLLDWYITWLTEMNSNIDSPYKIGPQNNNWYRFIKWLEEAIHGDHVSRCPTLDKRKYNG